jgi:hypothetical protein
MDKSGFVFSAQRCYHGERRNIELEQEVNAGEYLTVVISESELWIDL